MPRLKYKCEQCQKDFMVKYLLMKPGDIVCPHCNSPKVQEQKSSGCGCGYNNNSGSRFT